MRILCLHGVGSSGSILASQLIPFSRALDPSYELLFVDGPFECERGPGIPDDVEGPFYSHTTSYSPEGMAVAVDCLRDQLEDLGPVDGVFAFSQGAATLIAYLYEQQMAREPSYVDWAIICSSAMPCGASTDIADDVVAELCDLNLDLFDKDAARDSSLSSPSRHFVDALQRTIVPAWKDHCLMPRFDMEIYNEDDGVSGPRVMVPAVLKEKIRLPTVHIRGKKDARCMWNMSEIAQSAFDPEYVKLIEHGSGHVPPQQNADVKAAIRAMDWAIARASRSVRAHL